MYTKVHFNIIHGKKESRIQKICSVHTIMKKKKRDFVKGLLSIIFDRKDIMNRLEHWLFHIDDFHHKHIILPTNNMITKVFKEERHMSCLASNGFING